jgi:hypothetical protein
MLTTNPIVRIELKLGGECRLIAHYKNGNSTVLGTTPTERGARRMLTVRAKQFGLAVRGDRAE